MTSRFLKIGRLKDAHLQNTHTDQRFNYDKKSITAKQAYEPIPAKGRRKFFERTPKNDPGVIRGVVDERKI